MMLDYPLVYHIYGPVEDEDYWNQCQKLITEMPLHITVEYKGDLVPEQVITKLSQYDFFYMPTKGENYGHVIAEALCAGLPLVISNTTPWRNLKHSGLGWDLPLDNINTFSSVINELAQMPINEHLKMRNHILNWAKQKFTEIDAVQANINMFNYAYKKRKGTNKNV
ncbi:glycosyltransferase [Psychrobacter lutiphocae]|uniref:glycosyltransferase n=1 Tax=Psychrobacter lutiphocae TaxID=540500 RepID=UPI001918CE66|nr:glycosyltransferase [Psychrobacter lutiphocae]